MNSFDTITQFLGWCTVINMAVLTFLALFLMTMRESAARINDPR